MLKVCKHCESEFDTEDPRKIKVGGFINECADCVEENGGDCSPPKYLGVSAGDGKIGEVTVLAFSDNSSREKYQKMWRNNSGQNKGKSCQLGTHLTPTTGIGGFKIVGRFGGNGNHKGRAQ